MIDLKKLQPEYLSITDIEVLNSLEQHDYETLAESFKRKFNFLKIEIEQKNGRKSVQSGGYNHLRNHAALGNKVTVLEILNVNNNFYELPIDTTKIELPTLEEITLNKTNETETISNESADETTNESTADNSMDNDIDNQPKRGRKKTK